MAYDLNSEKSTAYQNESENESDIAEQLHALTFVYSDVYGNTEIRNTWDDWHLVPTSRPTFSMPQLKKYSQDIPGGNGELDFTSSLTGYPAYQNRTGSIEFIVLHQGIDTSIGSFGYNNIQYSTSGSDGAIANNTGWQGTYSEIANFLHGKYLKVCSKDLQDYYFKGRVTVNEWKSDSAYSSITLNYDLDPFMYTITDSSNLWKWDPFNFNTGIIREYSTSNMAYGGNSNSKTFRIIGTVTPVIPTIYVSADSYLITPDSSTPFTLKTGENKNPLIVIYPGEQEWRFSVIGQKQTTTTTNSDGTATTEISTVYPSANAAIYFRERSL